ncbi:MAG: type I-A CRISPR-associated protein Cas4/Csa1 [Chloroflexi bacterium]|nr:type I-A CRISPR-associated protein Cas4/Csa1 [Chloroflexota bacterium]
MYFLSNEEKRLLLRRQAPQARERAVAEELRGWNWDKPPLSPIFDTRLGVYEVAGHYCPTGRDLYLRRVTNVRVPPSPAMAEGGYLHALLCRIILAAKRALYTAETNPLDALQALQEPALTPVEGPGLVPIADEPDVDGLREKAALLWNHEYRQIVARVQDVLARQPRIGIDSLVNLALPVIVEQKLDGTFLGLSPHLSVDAFVWSEPMVLDVKFGRKEPFHRLSTTGYALVMESIYEYPVNLGCLVYASFADGRVLLERDFHVIDDELRQWFIEARDERARLVEEEIDPGLPEQCPLSCPYYRVCHPE